MILYTDKNELFECDIKLEGASLKDTNARLILETDKWNLMFYGKVNESGKCKINIDKLKILTEGTIGVMRLEVIAEDSFFVPWTDNFTIKTNKKVFVEVKNNDNDKLINEGKPKVLINNINDTNNVKINNTNTKNINENKINCYKYIITELNKNDINVFNLKTNIDRFKNIINFSMNKYSISDKDGSWVTNKLIEYLGK